MDEPKNVTLRVTEAVKLNTTLTHKQQRFVVQAGLDALRDWKE